MSNIKISEALQLMRTIHWTITLVPVLFSLVDLYLYYSGGIGSDANLQNIFLYSSLAILIAAILGSGHIFKLYLKNNGPAEPTSAQAVIPAFQTAHLVRLSVLEMAGLFAAVGTFITGYLPILGVVAMSTVVMVSLAPTPFKVAEAFGLDPSEFEVPE